MYSRGVGEKRRLDDIDYEDVAIKSLCRLNRPVSPKTAMEQEKRMRREIANSNERRRMQSINAGFSLLKSHLPHHDGEKLSKAAILQKTAEYIYQLEQDRARLLSQNSQLKRILNRQHHGDNEGSPTGGESPFEDHSTSSTPGLSSESVGATEVEAIPEDLQKELKEMRDQYKKERRRCCELEDRIKTLEEGLENKNSDDKQYFEIERKVVKIEPELPKSVKMEPEVPNTLKLIHKELSLPLQDSPRNTAPTIHAVSSSATAIVTVVPSTKVTALTKGRSNGEKVEVNPVPRVPSPATVECVEDSSGKNQVYYIVNSMSSQKSLDTICEAIRHLEGDHMFPSEERTALKEGELSDQTYIIESATPLSLVQDAPVELTKGKKDIYIQPPTTQIVSTISRPGVIVVKQP